jgi:hypothetical protein
MKYFFVLSLLAFSILVDVSAQMDSSVTSTSYNKLIEFVLDEYGFDQSLVNGLSFEDKYRNVQGHRFLGDDYFYPGSVILRGKEYKDVRIKYNIFEEQLVLSIPHKGSVIHVVPPIDFVSTFSFDGKSFTKYNIEDKPGFFEVIFDSEKLKYLYSWSKSIFETNSGGNNITYKFSDSENKRYIMFNGSLTKFIRNRSFTEIFPGEIRDRVRGYMTNNHINVARSSEKEMIELITYCNSLL